VVKLAVGRQRPFVRYGNWEPGSREGDPDDNLSFYSGHSALAFSIAAASGTVSTLRGYHSAPWVWAVGMTLASGVGYLRMAGDKHWLTDVLVGAAVGGGVGAAVPLLLHGREERPPQGGGASPAGARVVPLPMGLLVVW
jgi:membrane-associated phospholipid phosphatase